MGRDKSLISYHAKAQCYEVYELLLNFCSKVFVSCNAQQAATLDPAYEKLEDLPVYAGTGPAAGVRTAFSNYPGRNFLVIGCDYPFLTEKEIRRFLANIRPDALATAFFDEREQCYQPVLAWYSAEAGSQLLQGFGEDGLGEQPLSLQSFLKKINADRYYPLDPASMLSIDTPAASVGAKQRLSGDHQNADGKQPKVAT